MAFLDRMFGRSQRAPAPTGTTTRRPVARYLRDTAQGALSQRAASLVTHQDEVTRAWDRIAALALDFIQNSGRLKGAVDQVLADTVGVELRLNARPNLSALGYDQAETVAWARLVEQRWRRWSWTPAECDFRGRLTVPQMVDVALRHQIAYGEAIGLMAFWDRPTRAQYGITTGTKFCLIPPHRLVRETNEWRRLHAGVWLDENGRPTGYRVRERRAGFDQDMDYAARDAAGRPQVIHVFDPWDADDTRGVSVLASAMRTHAYAEQLGDATLTTAVLQTVFAATLTSPNPSIEAFEAIQALAEEDPALSGEFVDFFAAKMEAATEGVHFGAAGQVSHMGPGEKLELLTAQTPHNNYLPFSADLRREMARAIGTTYSAFSMDHSDATYSSVRMETASIWPVVLRRRERIAAPIKQSIFESWLDEEIGEGRIPLRGGYRAFQAHRDDICWAEWQGPARPTADDKKSAQAATERLQNGTSYLGLECAEHGLSVEDVVEQRQRERDLFLAAGLGDPFAPRPSGAAATPTATDGEEDGTGTGKKDAKT